MRCFNVVIVDSWTLTYSGGNVNLGAEFNRDFFDILCVISFLQSKRIRINYLFSFLLKLYMTSGFYIWARETDHNNYLFKLYMSARAGIMVVTTKVTSTSTNFTFKISLLSWIYIV